MKYKIEISLNEIKIKPGEKGTIEDIKKLLKKMEKLKLIIISNKQYKTYNAGICEDIDIEILSKKINSISKAKNLGRPEKKSNLKCKDIYFKKFILGKSIKDILWEMDMPRTTFYRKLKRHGGWKKLENNEWRF